MTLGPFLDRKERGSKEHRKEDDELEESLAENEPPHDGPDEEGFLAERAALKEHVGRVLGREGERCKGVHDHVDPEELHSGERNLKSGERSDERDDEGSHIDCDLELHKLADVVVDGPAPLDGHDDRRETVVENHNVSGTLCNLSPRNVHREADVCSLEGRGVVGPVTRRADDLSLLLEQVDEVHLVGGLRAREHAEHREHLDARLFVLLEQFAEVLALHRNLLVVGQDSAVVRDEARRVEVVTRNHADDDTRPLANVDRRGCAVAQRVLEAEDRNEHAILAFRDAFDLALFIKLDIVLFKVAVADANGAQPLERHAVHLGDPDLLVERRGLAVALVYLCALGDDALCGAAQVEPVPTVDAHEHPAALDLRVKGEHLDDLLGVALAVRDDLGPVAAAHKREHACLGLVAVDPVPVLGRRVGVVVVAVGVDDRAREDDRLFKELLKVSSLRHLALAELAGNVLLDDCHLSRGQRPCLVRADGRNVAHRLARREHLDKVVVLFHGSHRVGERDRDRKREALGDRDDDDGDGDDKVGQDIAPVAAVALFPGLTIGNPKSEQRQEENDRDARAHVADERGELVELELQRGLLDLDCEELHDLAVRRPGSGRGDDHLARALFHLGRGPQERVLGRVLGDVDRLPGHGRLVDVERVGLNDDPVGWNRVARLEVHQVTHNDLIVVQDLQLASAVHGDGWLLLLILLRAEGALLRPVVESAHRHHNDDGELNRKPFDPTVVRVVDRTDDDGEDTSNDQHHEHWVLHLLPAVRQVRAQRRLWVHVVPEYAQPVRVRGLVVGEALLQVRLEFGRHSSRASKPLVELEVALELALQLEVLRTHTVERLIEQHSIGTRPLQLLLFAAHRGSLRTS